MATMRTGVGHVARWGLLVTASVMGAALVATSWASYRSVQRAAETLARGQSEAILQSARRLLEGRGGPPAPQVLESFLEEHAAVGLRYVALINPEGRVVVEAGERLGELPDVRPPERGPGPPPRPEDVLLDLGPRFQIFFRVPPPVRCSSSIQRTRPQADAMCRTNR